MLRGSWPPSKAHWDGSTSLLALGATAGGLAALAADAPTDALATLVAPSAGFRSWTFIRFDLFDTDEVRHLGDLAAVSGVSGSTLL
jgi:hypothetical protein